MCSLDITSLYTNVPVGTAIEYILNKCFETVTSLFKGFNLQQFRKLLELSLLDSYFKFGGKIYRQLEGLAMGASLSPTVANIFLNSFETDALEACPPDIKPLFYRRYLDDTFILFHSENQAKEFFNFINYRHESIKFTFEGEVDAKLPFLDVLVQRSANGFITHVYRKNTFSGLGTNYFSNIAHSYKLSSITTLLHRAYNLCSNFRLFHEEISFIRKYLIQNYYPERLFDKLVSKFLNKTFSNKPKLITVPKEKFYVELPFIGSQQDKLRAEISTLLNKFFPQLDFHFFTKNTFKIGSLFRRTEKPERDLRAFVVYKYTCDRCQRSYIGSTKVQMFKRIPGHGGYSFRTRQPLSSPENSSIRNHCLDEDHPFRSDNFTIIDQISGTLMDLRTLESLYIHRERPTLNDNQSAIPLHLV